MTNVRRAAIFIAISGLAFLPPVLKSIWIGLGHSPSHSGLRLCLGIVWELFLLGLMYWHLRSQGATLARLGLFRPTSTDILHGLTLFLTGYGAMNVAYWLAQYLDFFLFRSWFQPFQHSEWLFGDGLVIWPLLLVVVNPLFEELGVRAWFTTGLVGLTGSIWIASISSWLLQTVAHFYQGPWNMVGLSAMFLCFTVYYARQRRIFPVVVAHFLADLMALAGYLFRYGATHK